MQERRAEKSSPRWRVWPARWPRHAVAAAVLTCAALLWSPPSALADALTSEWVNGYNNQARLHGGRLIIAADKSVIAGGIEIAMPPGWKTYWRTPGEAGGIPPEIDWSGSENISAAELHFPAPERIVDKSGAVVGYHDSVIFPLVITPKNQSKPVRLKVIANYGVCNDLCVPAQAVMDIDIPVNAEASDSLNAAWALVPKRDALQASDPVLASWHLNDDAVKPSLEFKVRDPGTATPSAIDTDTAATRTLDAFVEAPDGLYLPLPKPVATTDDVTTFVVDLSDGADLKALRGKQLTLTLVGATGQSEATLTLP